MVPCKPINSEPGNTYDKTFKARESVVHLSTNEITQFWNTGHVMHVVKCTLSRARYHLCGFISTLVVTFYCMKYCALNAQLH